MDPSVDSDPWIGKGSSATCKLTGLPNTNMAFGKPGDNHVVLLIKKGDRYKEIARTPIEFFFPPEARNHSRNEHPLDTLLGSKSIIFLQVFATIRSC